MKPLRFLSRSCAFALLCLSTYSCVDSTYDLSDLSGKAELFKNTLSAPVGTMTIQLDSVIGGMGVSSSILNVNNDNIYEFHYDGSFDLENLSQSFNNFQLTTIEGQSANINIYDASAFPSNTPAFPLPATEAQTHHGTTVFALPPDFGSTSLINIDSVSLTNTKIDITTNYYGIAAGNGTELGDNVVVTFTAVGDAADYYVDGVKKTTWDVKLGEPCEVEIRKIRLNGGANKLELSRDVKVMIPNPGDIMVTQMIQTYVTVGMNFQNGIDYDMVWGNVNYDINKTDVDPIAFDGLGKIINDNEVLSIYNPKITLNSSSNLGVPIDLTLYMNTINSRTQQTSPGLTNSTFRLNAAPDTATLTPSSITLDRTNGTAGLFAINPDSIYLSYEAHVVTILGQNHFIAKNSVLNMDYTMSIPLQFGDDLRISIDTTLENPFGDNMEKLDSQEDLSVALTLDVENKIPLNMQLELVALDENFNSLFTVKTDPIEGAEVDGFGKSTSAKQTTTDLNLSADDIQQLKYTKMFKVAFLVTAKTGVESVSVQPTDYITIKIGGKINGGVIFDFNTSN